MKSGPRRNRFSCSSARRLISGVRSLASSSEIPCGTSGGGRVGNGCVGNTRSPGTSVVVSTGRSSIGQIGCAGHAIEHVGESLLRDLRDDVDALPSTVMVASVGADAKS